MTIGVLALLWWTSLALITAAMVALGVLVVARLFRQKRARRMARDRSAVTDACLMVLAGDASGPFRLAASVRSADFMAEVVLDLAATVRGVDRDRLVRTLVVVGIDQRLRARLERGDLRGRIAAAEALASFPGAETLEAVGRVYRSTPHATLRIAALSTLIDLGAPPSPNRLLADIERMRDPDSLIHHTVLRRLAPTAGEALARSLADRRLRPETRAMIAEALGAGGDYAHVERLSTVFASVDPRLREAVVRALGALAHPDGAPVILKAFSDPSWEVRAEACVAAGRLGGRAFASHLNIALSDEVWWVRFRAAEALKSAGPLGIATLEVASRSAEGPARRSAQLALAERIAA